jgi:hypothetical protein
MRKRKGALLRISIEIETTKKSLFYLLAQSVSVYPTSNVGTLVSFSLLSAQFHDMKSRHGYCCAMNCGCPNSEIGLALSERFQ